MQGEVENSEEIVKTKTDDKNGNPGRHQPRKNKDPGKSPQTYNSRNNLQSAVDYSFPFVFYISGFRDF